MKLYVNYLQLPYIKKMFQFFSQPSHKSQPPLCFLVLFLLPLILSHSPAAAPMSSPTELIGDEIDGETARSGDDDPIPSQYVADSFSQVPGAACAPWNLHGVTGGGLEVGGVVGGGLQGPSPALRVGLSRGNSLGATGR
jgi:hypothetical protein